MNAMNSNPLPSTSLNARRLSVQDGDGTVRYNKNLIGTVESSGVLDATGAEWSLSWAEEDGTNQPIYQLTVSTPNSDGSGTSNEYSINLPLGTRVIEADLVGSKDMGRFEATVAGSSFNYVDSNVQPDGQKESLLLSVPGQITSSVLMSIPDRSNPDLMHVSSDSNYLFIGDGVTDGEGQYQLELLANESNNNAVYSDLSE